MALLHPGDRHVVERELAREIVVHVLDQALRGHRCANSEYLNPRHLVPTAEDYVLQLLEQDRPVVDGGVPRGGLAQQRVALELALLLRVLVLVHLSLVLVILPVVVVVLLPPSSISSSSISSISSSSASEPDSSYTYGADHVSDHRSECFDD